ncbi:MAG: hypothetical protein AAGA43_15190 [Bacteroidota bacterium]
MKKVIQQVISVAMSLMVLLSTISWSVDKHLCMGRVMDVSFFSQADDCGMEAALSLIETNTEKPGCCDDESFVLTGQDDLKLTWSDLDLEQQNFLIAFTTSYLDVFVPLEELPVPHEEYPPPILVRDIQVLDQVFLI